MTPFSKDYIVPGDVFADEMVLCMRCAAKIMILSYKEMPKINSPKETVNVAYKMKLFNYRQIPVILYRKGQESITSLPVCRDCIKEIVPEDHSEKIVGQIMRAMQMESRWVGSPEEVAQGIARQFIDARIIRKLTAEEVMENRILETV